MGRLFFFYSFLCFVLLISECFSSSFDNHLCSPTEAYALLQFKQQFEIISDASYSCDRASFPKTKSWNESRDCCTWDGVTCDMLTGHVISLDLSCSQLIGNFHPNSSLFQLHHLHTLNLAYNYFNYSSIPHNIGRLTNLRHLNLSRSFFDGKIPTEISYLSNLVSLDLSPTYKYGLQLDKRTFEAMLHNLTNLEVLSLSYVNISSPIPVNISSSLRYLDLGYTNLRDVLTESFFLLPNSLETLKLSYNHLLKGFLPKIHLSNTLLELDISYTSISGELPDSIGTLSSLNILDLYGCQFSGAIPDSIGNLTQIRELRLPSLLDLKLHHNQFSRVADEIQTNPTLVTLYLSHNQLNGPFPRSLVNLTSLAFLDFSSNNITGDVGINITFPRLSALFLSSCELKDFPHFLRNLKTLQFLDISNNKIRGRIPNWFSSMRWDILEHLNGPLPSFICNLSSLRILDISRNNFSNSIPNCLGIMANLTVLDIRSNNFSGSLPLLCTQSTSLTTIVLNGNQFEGSVPASLQNCVGLKVLDLGNNAINDTFPAWLGTLQELQVLILKSNKFHGPIMIKDWPMYKLEMAIDQVYKDSVRLMIKGNNIELERISTIVTAIDLSSNHFEGDIPKSLKDLGSLWLLNLSHNNLKGDIPMELGQLNTLEALDLSWNRLTGKIPQELTRMNFLAFLNLSQNHLVGRIPQGSQFYTFENDSYGGNLDLCGPPLSKQCGMSDSSHVPQPLDEEEEHELYFFSGFTWESVVIGYNFGLVVGTIMWSLMFNYPSMLSFSETCLWWKDLSIVSKLPKTWYTSGGRAPKLLFIIISGKILTSK
ncbi:hypothetical protein KY284_011292 [Solanum tuberosum]|nr:hypothetical protein KY284_011292 [Solanum tuberosum]